MGKKVLCEERTGLCGISQLSWCYPSFNLEYILGEIKKTTQEYLSLAFHSRLVHSNSKHVSDSTVRGNIL